VEIVLGGTQDRLQGSLREEISKETFRVSRVHDATRLNARETGTYQEFVLVFHVKLVHVCFGFVIVHHTLRTRLITFLSKRPILRRDFAAMRCVLRP